MEFGVQESWVQFLEISYHNIEIYYYNPLLVPLCLSENGDTLVLVNCFEEHVICYNWRLNKVELTRISGDKLWFFVNNYVESLVSTNGK